MRSGLLYIILLLLTFPLVGQDKYMGVEPRLESLFIRLGTVKNDSNRLAVNDSICSIINDYSRSDSVFTHSLGSLKHLGQVMSPDSSFKIISWNVNLENFGGKYFSYLIKRENEKNKNKVISLQASYKNNRPSEDTTYHEADWYGALYYGIKPYIFNGEKYWVVLGLDYGNPLKTRKLIDVISFDDNGSVTFGKKWFETNRGIKYRKIFEYASVGMMSLRFSSDTSIVFDHLVPIASESRDNQVFYGSDYSYDSFTYNNGLWKLKVNVDARNNEQR